MNEEILKTIRERGLLLEKEVFELVNSFGDENFAKDFLEKIERISGQKMITRAVLNKNVEFVRGVIDNLPGDKSFVEKVFVNLGLTVEVRTEREVVNSSVREPSKQDFSVFYADTKPDKKIEVKDFVGHYRSRFQQMQKILMSRPELQENLVSIGKISSDRRVLSIIGSVVEKRLTKNKNLIIRFEDLTGEINSLIKFDKEEVFRKGDELQLDDIVGVKASGNREMLFITDIFFPDSFVHETPNFEEEMEVCFLSDLHIGSDRHLRKSFENFLDWLNGPDAKKIKYLFFTGDNVDGVGVFPMQEEVLSLKKMEEQYNLLVYYLKKVPKRITIFMCPGQHDACRVAEPQPLISRKYAPGLYELENLVLVTNPCLVKLLEKGKEFKVLMYHGASLHSFINGIPELRDKKAHTCPASAVKHMLKRRHLAPTHGEIVYIPNMDVDPLVISEVPHVITTGEVHRTDVENYHGTTIVACSCWQAQTPFEEKIGNIPDPCKVPVLNLKTHKMKIMDFGDSTEVNENGVWQGGSVGGELK